LTLLSSAMPRDLPSPFFFFALLGPLSFKIWSDVTVFMLHAGRPKLAFKEIDVDRPLSIPIRFFQAPKPPLSFAFFCTRLSLSTRLDLQAKASNAQQSFDHNLPRVDAMSFRHRFIANHHQLSPPLMPPLVPFHGVHILFPSFFSDQKLFLIM